MKIYLSADIEGITGITDWAEANLAEPDNAQFRERMTAEVAAACEGAIAAGASEILVKDAHWTRRVTRFPYILPYRVREQNVEIMRVFHTARRWPADFQR